MWSSRHDHGHGYLSLSSGQKRSVRSWARLWRAGGVLVVVLVAAVVSLLVLRAYVVSWSSTQFDNFQRLNDISVVTLDPPASPVGDGHAVVTSLYSDSYIAAVMTLGHSLRSADVSARMILMYLPDRVSSRNLCLASAAGWTLHAVPFIPPPHNGKDIYKPFDDQYTKLNLWKLDSIGITRLVYLDADTLIRKNFNELFALPFTFAAVPDVFLGPRGFTVGFNAGILFLRPSTAIFEDMLSKLETADYPLMFAEQAFLNLYFGAQAARLPYAYNANLAIKRRSAALWAAVLDDVRIVHYTVEKPFPYEWLGSLETEEFFDERKRKDGGFWADEMGWWQDSWRTMEVEMRDEWSRCL